MRFQLVIFTGAMLVCGLAFWWYADWWLYMDKGDGPVPKATMPWWFQLGMSGMVGAGAGVVLASFAWAVRRVLNRRQAS